MAHTALEDQHAAPAVATPPETGTDTEPPTTLIRASSGWRALDLRELWRYRELVYFLAWRDVKVRYRQTVLGVAWAILQPVVQMLLFTFVFGGLAGITADGVPYPLFAFAGLLPWGYFATATAAASGSLVANTHLVSKVYFPRLVVPLAAVIAGLVDLAVATSILAVLLAFFGRMPGPSIAFLPALVALAVLTALAVSVWLSALDVQYRDVRYAIPFLIQVWMFLSPVVYPASRIPEQWRVVYGLNPMAGVVEGFRWVLLGQEQPPILLLVLSMTVVLVGLLTGLLYFRRMERTFADVI